MRVHYRNSRRWVAPSYRHYRVWVMSIAWYVVGLAVLVSPLGAHPDFPYNWESYTAWHVFGTWVDRFEPSDAFALTDGLMTDSGHGPLVGVPVWIGFHLGGVGLAAMRWSVMLVAALAIPLTWLVGRRLVGDAAALLATALLAISPVWLLYGRTATLVGVSVVPALLTVAVLLHVLESRGRRLLWLMTLQVLLVSGAYAYAPIRFLWPLSLGLIALSLVRGPARWWWFAALVITLVTLPLGLAGIVHTTATDTSVLEAIAGYYNARGEQILALNEHPENYAYYLKDDGDTDGTRGELAWRLVQQNTADLGRLLLDHDTAPALTHYYNPKGQPVGRLYPRILFPFLALGVATSLWKSLARRRREDLVLLTMASGFTLPILLTSKVHIGRLVFALPLLFLLVAMGTTTCVAVLCWLINRAHGRVRLTPMISVGLTAALGTMLVGGMAGSLHEENRLRDLSSRDAHVVMMLETMAHWPQAVAGVALITDDAPVFEAVAVSGYRLMLDSQYRFIDLSIENARPIQHGEIPLYYGSLLDRMQSGAIPHYCSNIYLVAPAAEVSFLQSMTEFAHDSCSGSLRHARLPR